MMESAEYNAIGFALRETRPKLIDGHFLSRVQYDQWFEDVQAVAVALSAMDPRFKYGFFIEYCLR